MWKIIQEILPILLFILLLTQYIIPLLFNSQTWWLFRKSKNLKEELGDINVIIGKNNNIVNDINNKIEENLKIAKDLKKKANNLNKKNKK